MDTVTEPVVVLPAPAAMPEDDTGAGAWTTTLPMLGGVGSMLMVAGSAGAGGRGYVVGALFLVSTVAMAVTQVVRQRRTRARSLGELRARHRVQLTGARREVQTLAAAQRARAEESWGRGCLRVGVADVRLPARLQVQGHETVAAVDPVSSHALDAFVATWSVTPDVPVAVDLARDPHLSVRGPAPDRVAAARSLLVHAATSHPAGELRIAVLTTPERLAEWEWVKWLPHAWSTAAGDDVGPSRLVLTDAAALDVLVEGDPARLLLLVDGSVPPPTGAGPTTGPRSTVVLGGTGRAPHLVVLPDSPRGVARLHRPDSPTVDLRADLLTRAEAEAAARRLTAGAPPACAPAGPTTTVDLLGFTQVSPASEVASLPVEQRLDVPIGTDATGAPVRLNLRESAHGGTGPHGLVVGATGSGKSELVRTLVLALAAQHRPDELALVLVDFKGGATFSGLGRLPHVSALVTNLSGDHSLVARMEDALAGELDRRQEVLHASGHANLRAYDAARRAGADLAPLPSLFVCVDEFSELLTARPEFIDLFVAIGRLGRSLGIHLLLATQRLEEGRLRGLESHLSYRIGLRTFSASESRAAIGVPDAHALPSRPGVGLLRRGADDLVRFDAAYVSGPLPETAATAPTTDRAPLLPFALAPVLLPRPHTRVAAVPATVGQTHAGTAGTTLLDDVVDRLVDGTGVHRIWLPPLSVPATIGDHLTADALVLGEVDLPREQRREPLTFDLTGATGHFAVVGGPRTGRSTVLQSLVGSLALRTTPWESQFLLADLGGGALAPLEPLPHVLALASRGDDLLGRVVQEATDLVDGREAAFADAGATSVEEYRVRTGEPLPEVYVVVDGWGTLRAEHEDLELSLARLAGRALSFGVHLVLATTRWNDLRPTLRDLVGSRLELRLGDPLDSEVDRRRAARVPVGRPGRGIDASGHDVLTVLPRIDGDHDPDTATDGLRHLVETVRSRWHGDLPRRLRVLPDLVVRDALAPNPAPSAGASAAADAGVTLGLDETGPMFTVLDDDPHLLVLGGDRSGRTETLRTFLCQLTATYGPERAQVVVVDPRGGLRDVVGEAHLVAHLGTRSRIVSGLTDLAAHLRGRLPGAEVPAAQLADRSWWTGPEVYVVVDDHDLVTAGAAHESPTRVLADLLPVAHEVGLHLVLARRTESTRTHEPVLAAMTELGSPTLLLAGDPASGVSVGALRPRPGPPGRGRLVSRRGGVRTVQVALCAERDEGGPVSDDPSGTSPGRPHAQRSA